MRPQAPLFTAHSNTNPGFFTARTTHLDTYNKRAIMLYGNYFKVIGPSGSNVVNQAGTDLQTWIPLQTNLLGSGPLYFSDAHSTTNVRRLYRVQLSP
jgi:hypothetical protein